MIISNCQKMENRKLFMIRKRRLFSEILKNQKKVIQNLLKLNSLYGLLLNNVIPRRIWQQERMSRFWENEVTGWDNKSFKEHFGVTRNSFNKLVTKLRNLRHEDTNMRPAIPLEKRNAISLYALRSSAECRTISNLFSVGVSTVAEMVLEFCKEVYSVMKDEYFDAYPPTQEKIDEITRGFADMGFPQCYGAIDGCHIEVCPPKADATDYYNFKGWYSIILFAVADYKCRFTYINVGATARNNDSSIFEASSLKRVHETHPIFIENSIHVGDTEIPVLLLGDSAFRLSPFLVKPYPFNVGQNEREKMFNYRLSKVRRVVENSFGQLKARFGKIGKGLEVKIDNAYPIVQACCILHNFCIAEKDLPFDSWFETNPDRTSSQRQRHTIASNSESVNVRNALARQFYEEVDGNGGSPGELEADGTVSVSASPAEHASASSGRFTSELSSSF